MSSRNLLMMFAAMGGNPAVVTLSGGNVFVQDPDISGPYQSIGGFRINADGTVDSYRFTNDAPEIITQLHPTTDWIIPNLADKSGYEFMLTVNSGGTPNFDSDTVGSFIPLGLGCRWNRVRTVTGTENFNWTISVRRNGGATITSAGYSGAITNGGF